MNRKIITRVLLVFLSFQLISVQAQRFIHPGIAQSREDLAFMKQMVSEKKQPWQQAFLNLKTDISKEAGTTPSAHVKRGPYGKPNIGADQLSRSAEKVYQWALYWYLTGDDAYAEKATSLLMDWSDTLMDFDYNDAKLLAAWTGHKLCNAAEILRYHYPKWTTGNTERFSKMLMTVYYPLLRFYFPEANGNWDGAIIHSLMAIGIFTDNQKIFDHAVAHFLYGPVNGSIFKYIFPHGQCQETMRDQAHVQLGLGEFAGAAHIAYTQGTDLFSVGNNRLALGFEYTAGFLNGKMPLSYGPVSHRAMRVRDDYEYVVRHYQSKGIPMPESEKKLDSTRLVSSVSVLAATRKPTQKNQKTGDLTSLSPFKGLAGAYRQEPVSLPANAVRVEPGASIQEALNATAGTGKWVVAAKGIHVLSSSLVIPSGITLAGEGKETILFLDPKSGKRDALVNEDPALQNVTIRDLVIEAGTQAEPPSDPNSIRSFRAQSNRGGILFQAPQTGKIRKVTLERVTVRGATYNGAFLNGIEDLKIISCDFNENGGRAVPGPKIQHNLLLTHCKNVAIDQCRFSTSPFGSGIAITACENMEVKRSEIVRNAYYGILVTESKGLNISENLVEGNDRSGIMVEYLWKGSDQVNIASNTIHFNGSYGIESFACKRLTQDNNVLTGNRETSQFAISGEKKLIQQ